MIFTVQLYTAKSCQSSTTEHIPFTQSLKCLPQGNATENPQQRKTSRMVVLSQMQLMFLTLYHKLKYPVHQRYECTDCYLSCQCDFLNSFGHVCVDIFLGETKDNFFLGLDSKVYHILLYNAYKKSLPKQKHKTKYQKSQLKCSM